MKYLKYLLLLSLCGCTYNNLNINKDRFYIYQIPEKESIIKALDIVFNEFVEQKVYTKKQILDAIYNKNLKRHTTCIGKNHKLRVVFTEGKWIKEIKRFCIFSNSKHLKGKCLHGLFNGKHTVTMVMIKNKKIYQTTLAHEIFHYLQTYIDGTKATMHEPKELWENLVGYKIKEIGVINEALENADL